MSFIEVYIFFITCLIFFLNNDNYELMIASLHFDVAIIMYWSHNDTQLGNKY